MLPLKHRLESLFEETEYEHLHSYAFLINKHWIYFILFHFFFYKLREMCSSAIGEVLCWRHDVRAAACGTLHPPPPAPLSPERHTLSGRQPKGQSSPHIFSASTTDPSILPVWWILFSALLSWVIWGIIPKVSKLNCMVLF